jgi:5-methylcytosine-specific restriction endonuclease McrBC GTP-binding regulatory subunit McrB
MQTYFYIKDTFTYKKVYTYFIKYLEGISRNIDIKRPFSQNHIQKNIYIIQKLYSKKLNDDLLDESTFLRLNTTVSNLPIRMTPFGRKPLLGARNIPALSHKILSYDINEQENKS